MTMQGLQTTLLRLEHRRVTGFGEQQAPIAELQLIGLLTAAATHRLTTLQPGARSQLGLAIQQLLQLRLHPNPPPLLPACPSWNQRKTSL